jgi:hypothetical protein
MPIVVKKPKKTYHPAPEGLHQAVCVDILAPWTEEDGFNAGRMVEKTRIFWVLDQTRTWKNDDGTEKQIPYEVSNTYTMSLHEKSNLCRHLEAWRGKKFTEKEKEGFDLESLIGANCQIQVVHNIKDSGEIFANVGAIVPIGKNMTKLVVPFKYERRKDRAAKVTDKPAGDAPAADDGDPGPTEPMGEPDDGLPF